MVASAKQSYDVIVVGSGASGGWACKRLAESGMKVALLEAGRPQSDKNFSEHTPPFELKYRNLAPEILRKTRPIQSKFDVCNEYTKDWFVNDLEEPYTTPSDKPFDWMGRLRMPGGVPTSGAAFRCALAIGISKPLLVMATGKTGRSATKSLCPITIWWKSMLA